MVKLKIKSNSGSIINNKDLMYQIRLSERNIKKGKIKEFRY